MKFATNGFKKGKCTLNYLCACSIFGCFYVLYDRDHTSKIMINQMKWLNSLIFGYSVVEDDDNDNNDKFDDGNNKNKWQIQTEERELMVSSMTSFII